MPASRASAPPFGRVFNGITARGWRAHPQASTHGEKMADWFARPILSVTDVAASLRFYVDRLGFASPWSYEEDGKVVVAQVDRQGCALLLSSHWPDKVGNGLIFVSLNVDPDTYEGHVAALDALRVELEARGVPVKNGSWGYRLLVVVDPDGNQLQFNYPNERS
jgi:uncharacterized glyoxalase superfamily protein PhnB